MDKGTIGRDWTQEEFKLKLLEKQRGYHIYHPFHMAMSTGNCTREQMQAWVANRFYYQINLPLKDAAILSNCPDRAVRSRWIQRILNADGLEGKEGGIDAWIKLGEACGLAHDQLVSCQHVLPAVRFAVDAYVNFARQAPWQEAVCSSLSELFAGAIHQERVEIWPQYYDWLDQEALAYFQKRMHLMPQELEFSLELTLNYFRTRQRQERALEILQFKLDILWSLLDAVAVRYAPEVFRRHLNDKSYVSINKRFRLQWEEAQNSYVLLYPEGMIQLNTSAGEILRLCNDQHTVKEIVDALEKDFPEEEIGNDVYSFLKEAHQQGWIHVQ